MEWTIHHTIAAFILGLGVGFFFGWNIGWNCSIFHHSEKFKKAAEVGETVDISVKGDAEPFWVKFVRD